ncbi:MAG TPA: TIGR02996 domain-containing protein [Gemmataceae bacterium]|jgi:uncharacterized protein (TIGR02996 family)|nr:TIGR02996 domain-containing protein [Gemmataceae bacterium]
MSDEAAFLRTILDNPDDDAPRLVYADWLDEQGTPDAAAKAVFLRTTAAHARASGRPAAFKRRLLNKQLHEAAHTLDSGWLAVVSQVPIEECFEFSCPKRWEALTATEDPGVRFCDSCQRSVHYSKTMSEARGNAWSGRCVAVQLGLPRRRGDLELPTRMLMGRIAAGRLDVDHPDEETEDRRRGTE